MAGAKTKVLDFSGVKDGGGNFRPRRKAEGDYFARVVAVADHTSKEGNEGWVFTIKVDGDARSTYPYYVNHDKEQLWKARGLCVATGMKVPTGKVKLDPNKLVNRPLGIALEDDEYEGRVKSTIAAVFPLDELSDARNVQDGKSSSTKAKSRQADEDYDEDDEDEDDEPAPRSKGKGKRAPEPDDDDDESDDEDEDEDDEPPAKSKKKAPAKRSKKSRDEDEDDEDDEEDEPPAKSKKSSTKAKSKKRAKDDDDDDELDIDDL